jgi:hypothetical protein
MVLCGAGQLGGLLRLQLLCLETEATQHVRVMLTLLELVLLLLQHLLLGLGPTATIRLARQSSRQ